MATMTITIKGIAICYYHYTTRTWKVLFPFNGDHTVKISESGSAGISLGFLKGEIKITHNINASTASLPPTTPDRFCDFLNITDKDHCHEKIRLTSNWDDHGVLMTVGNASFSIDELSRSHYLLRDEKGIVTRQPSIVGHSAKLILSADSIMVDALDGDGNPVFPAPFERDCDILIDNTCPAQCAHVGNLADFDMIYNVIEDASDRTRRFKLEREPGDGPNWLSRIINFIRSIIGLIFSWHPTDNNPAPGEEGLPCNIVVASDPGGLH